MRCFITSWVILALSHACTSSQAPPQAQGAPDPRAVRHVGNVEPSALPHVAASADETERSDYFDPPLGHEQLPSAPQLTANEPLTDATRAALSALRGAVPGLAQPSRDCRTRIVAAAHARGRACSDDAAALSQLADALDVDDVPTRDRRLWQLENCAAFPRGLIRALRAELDPSCADTIIEPLLADPKLQLSDDLVTTLLGLVYTARLRRAVLPIPALQRTALRTDIEQFTHVSLAQWRDTQVQRLRALESGVKTLPEGSYGQTIASLALATAWHDLASGARRATVPDSLKKDYILRTAYYGGSDELLNDAKQIAVQLSAKAALLASRHGVRNSPIATTWHRVAAQTRKYPALLSGLLLPIPPVLPKDLPRERVAYRLPPYYAGTLLFEQDLDNARLVRGLLDNGLSVPHRQYWQQHPPRAEIAELLAYARVGIARRTFDTIHFDEAIHLLQRLRVRVVESPELQLLLAVATAARTPTRGASSVWDTSLQVTHWERLQTLADHCTVASVRAFALADQATLRGLNQVPDAALDIEQLWGLALQASTGTGAEPCIAQQMGFSSRPWSRQQRACTLADQH